MRVSEILSEDQFFILDVHNQPVNKSKPFSETLASEMEYKSPCSVVNNFCI